MNNPRRVFLLGLTLLFWLSLVEVAAQGWYDPSWLYRKKLTIDYTKVSGGPLLNFPVLINRTDADLISKARSDGFDILFTSSDGTTKLNHEREKWLLAKMYG